MGNRVAVLDLSVLRGSREIDLPPGLDIALPHAIAAEIVTSDLPGQLAQKLQDFCCRYVDRLWVGNEWYDIVAKERSPCIRVFGSGWKHYGFTSQLRKAMSDPDISFAENVEFVKHANVQRTYENKRKFFLDWCKAIARYLDERQPHVVRDIKGGTINYEEIGVIVQDGNAVCDVLRSLGPTSMMDPYKAEPWQRALRENPANWAIGKWTQVMLWYGLLWAAGKTKGFENNWARISQMNFKFCRTKMNFDP